MKTKNRNSHSKKSYPQNNPQKYRQIFSDELKRKKVKEIEIGIIGVSELSRQLKVSRSSIYKWIKKYSLTYNKRINIIVESKSETHKINQLSKELKDAHEIIGKQSIELEFYKKLIELASDEFDVDLKKKFGAK